MNEINMATSHISVTPLESLVDERLQIRAIGLCPLQKVTIKAQMKERKTLFVSYGYFVADTEGEIDVSKQESIGGSYTGIHPMGLIWSMMPGPGEDRRTRYCKKDVTTPVVVNFTLWTSHLTSDELFNDETNLLSKCQVNRWYKAKDVKREAIKTGNVRGVLFTPPGTGPFPGVIDVFGMIGGLIEFRAALLASRGFVVFAMPLFGYDDLPKSVTSLTLEYLKESVEWLSNHFSVIPGGIGMIGVSKGGEICHLMTLHSPQVKAAVKINGPPFVFNFPIKSKDVKIPAATYDISKMIYTTEGKIMKDLYTPHESDFIQAWKNDIPMLCILGEDDQALNPQYNFTYYNMIPEDKKKNFIIVKYKGGGHLIEPPYAPFCRTSYEKNLGGFTIWGGNVVDHSVAQEDSWAKIQTFLRRHIVNNKGVKMNNKL